MAGNTNYPSLTKTLSVASGSLTTFPVQDARAVVGGRIEAGLMNGDVVTDFKVETSSGKPAVTITLAGGGTRQLSVTVWFQTQGY